MVNHLSARDACLFQVGSKLKVGPKKIADDFKKKGREQDKQARTKVEMSRNGLGA